MSTQNKKILMAVDPFEKELKPDQESIDALKKWLKETEAVLEVVFVQSCSPKGAFFDSTTIAHQALMQYCDSFNFETPVHPHVLVEQSESNRLKVAEVIKYAQRIGASMVVLTSYGRNLMGRLVLGSFADALLASCPVPLFFLTPRSNLNHVMFDRVLFPTDFSQSSKKAFELFLAQFKKSTIEVILFHVTPYLPESYWIEQNKRASDEGQKWIHYARSKGFNSRFIVQEESEEVTSAIMKVAGVEQVNLIALASSRGRIQTKIMGSVASEIFHRRAYPVWVCGPEALKFDSSMESGAKNSQLEKAPRSPLGELWES